MVAWHLVGGLELAGRFIAFAGLFIIDDGPFLVAAGTFFLDFSCFSRVPLSFAVFMAGLFFIVRWSSVI